MGNALKVITHTLLFYCAFKLSSGLSQSVISVGSPGIDGVLDLAHGLRVILAWLFGLTSISYLAPISFLTHWGLFDEPQSLIQLLVMPLFGLVCTPLVFEFADRLGLDLQLNFFYLVNWKNLVLVGFIASLVDALGGMLITSSSYHLMLVDLCGNISGSVVGLGVLQLGLRVARYLRS